MKKFFLTLVFLISINFTFGQSSNSASCSSKTTLIEGKEKGIIEIKLPESITKEEVEKYSKYYENAFKVNFDEKSHILVFKMVENNTSNRKVILRFLAANQIQHVIVEEKSYLVTDFYENFLK